MFNPKENRKKNKLACLIVTIAFITNLIGPWAVQLSYAQTAIIPVPAMNNLGLPPLGAMVELSPEFKPTIVKGLKVYPDNPFHFDFIVDVGQTGLKDNALSDESSKLIKYFLAALTVPEQDMWVNLSPYEKDRIIPSGFGQTEMGRDLLAQDYLLKQVASSLIYPENELGEIFWERVYQKAYEAYGTMEIAVSTFNKVWIVPEFAEVYENADTALIVDCNLKVLTEYDYLAEARAQEKSLDHLGMKTLNMTERGKANESLSNDILRDIVIPEIEKEINKGKNFVQLRQIYHSLILATWYKRKLKASVMSGHTPVLAQVYVGKNKVGGVDIKDKEVKEKIYEQYLAAFKKGVFNFIKEEYDPRTQRVIPRKYFSGGAELIGPAMDRALLTTQDMTRGELAYQSMEQAVMVKADITRTDDIQEDGASDEAMLGLLNPSRVLKAFQRKKSLTYPPAELARQWQFTGEHDPEQFTYVIKTGDIHRLFSELEYFQKQVHSYSVSTVSNDFLRTYSGQSFGVIMDVDPVDVLFVLRQMRWDIGVTDKNEQSLNTFIQRHLKEDQRQQAQDSNYQPNVLYNAYNSPDPVDLTPSDITQETEQRSDRSRTVTDPTAAGTAQLEGKFAENNELIIRNSARFNPKGFLFIAREGENFNETVDEFLNINFGRPILEKIKARQLPVVIVAEEGGDLQTAREIFSNRFPEFAETSSGKFVYQRQEQAAGSDQMLQEDIDLNRFFASQTIDRAMLGDWKESIFGFLSRKNRTPLKDSPVTFNQGTAIPLEYYAPYRRLYRAKGKGQKKLDVLSVLNNPAEMKRRVRTSFSNIKPQKLDFLIERQSSSIEQSILELVSNASDALTGRRAPIGRFGFGALQMLAFVLDENNPALANGAHVVVDTAAEAGQGRRMVFFKGNDGQIYFETQAIRKPEKGTKVAIQFPQGLPGTLKNSIQEHLRQRLNLFTKMKVALNGEVLNTLERYQYLNGHDVGYEVADQSVDIQVKDYEISVEDFGEGMSDDVIFNKYLIPRLGQNQAFEQTEEEIARDVHIFFKESQYGLEAKTSRVVFQVSGVNIQETTIEGYNLPEEMIIQLPASTLLTTSRDTIEIDDSTHTAVKALADKIMKARYSQQQRNSLINGLVRAMVLADEKNGRTKVSRSLVDTVKDVLLKSLLDLDAPVLPNQPEYHEILSSADTIFLEPELMYKLTPEQIPGSQEISGFKKGTFKKAFFVPFKKDSNLTYLPLGPYLLFNKDVYDKNYNKPLPLNFRLNFYVGYGPRQPTKGRILTLEEAAELEKVSIISLLEEHKNLSAVIPEQQMQWLDRYLEEQPRQRPRLQELLATVDTFVAALPNAVRDQIDTEQWKEILPFNDAVKSRLEELIARPQIIMKANNQFLQRHMTFFLNREHPERLERYLSNLFIANGLANLADPDILHATLSTIDAKALRFLDREAFEKIIEVFDGKNLEAYEEAFLTVNQGLPHVEDEGVNRLITRWLRVYDLDPERAKRFRQKMERVFNRQAPIRKKATLDQAHRLQAQPQMPQETFDVIDKDTAGNVFGFSRYTGVNFKGLPVIVSQKQDHEIIFYTYDRLTKEKTVIAEYFTRRSWTIKDVQWAGIVNEDNQHVFVVSDANRTGIIGVDFEEPDLGKRIELLKSVPFNEIGQEVKQKISVLKDAIPGKVLVALLGDFEVSFLELDQETGGTKVLKRSKIDAGLGQMNADFYDTGVIIDGKRLVTLKREAISNFYFFDEGTRQFMPYKQMSTFVQKGKIGERPYPVQSEGGEKRLLSFSRGKILVSRLFPKNQKKITTKSSAFETPAVDAFFQVEGLNDSQGNPVVVAYHQQRQQATIFSVDLKKMTFNKIGELPLGQIRKLPANLSLPLHSVEYIADDNMLLFNTGYGAMLFDLERHVRETERRKSLVARGVDVLSDERRFPDEVRTATARQMDDDTYLHSTVLSDQAGRRVMLVNSSDKTKGRQSVYEWDTQTGSFALKDTLSARVYGDTTVATGIQKDGRDIFFTISHREWGSRIKTFSFDRVSGRIHENFIDDKVLPRTNFNKIVKTDLGTEQRPVFIAQREDGLFFQVFSVDENGVIQGDIRLRNSGDRELEASNPMLSYHDYGRGKFMIDQKKSVDIFEYLPKDGSVHFLSSAPKQEEHEDLPMMPVKGASKEMYLSIDRQGRVVSLDVAVSIDQQGRVVSPDVAVGRLFGNLSESVFQTQVGFSSQGDLITVRPEFRLLNDFVTAKGDPVYSVSNFEKVHIFSVNLEDGSIHLIKEIDLVTTELFKQIEQKVASPVKHVEYDKQTKKIFITLPNGVLGIDLNAYLVDIKPKPVEPVLQRKIMAPNKFPERVAKMIKPDDGKTQYFRPTGLVDNLGEQLFIKSELNGPTLIHSYNVREKRFSWRGELTTDVGSTARWTGHSTPQGRAVFSSLSDEGKTVRFHFYDIVNSTEQDHQLFSPEPSFGRISDVIPTALGDEKRPIFAIINKQAVQLIQLDLEQKTITPVSDKFLDRRSGNEIKNITSTALSVQGDPVFIINRGSWEQYVRWNSEKKKIEFLRNVRRPGLDPLTASVPLTADGRSGKIVVALNNGFLAVLPTKEAEIFGEDFRPGDRLDEDFYLVPYIHSRPYKRILNLVALDGLVDSSGHPMFAAFTRENRLLIFSVDPGIGGKIKILKNYFSGVQGNEDQRDIHFSPQTGLLSIGSGSGLALLDLNKTFEAPQVRTLETTRRSLSATTRLPDRAVKSFLQEEDESVFMQPTRVTTSQGEQVFLKDHLGGETEVYAFDSRSKTSRRVGEILGRLENTKWTGLKDQQGRAIFTSGISPSVLRVHYFDLEKGTEVFYKDFKPDTSFGLFEDIVPTNFGTDDQPIFAIRNRDTVQLVQLNLADGTLTAVSDPLRDSGEAITDITASHLVKNGNPIFILNHQIKDQYVLWDRANQKLELLKTASRLNASAFTKVIPVSPNGLSNRVVTSTSSGWIMTLSKSEDDMMLDSYEPGSILDTGFYASPELSQEKYGQVIHMNALNGLFDDKGNPIFSAFTLRNVMLLFSINMATNKITILKRYMLRDLFGTVPEGLKGARVKWDIQFDPETGLLQFGSSGGISILDLNAALRPKDLEPKAEPGDLQPPEAGRFDLREAFAQVSDHHIDQPSLLLESDVLVRTVKTIKENIEFSQTTQFVTPQGEQVFIEKIVNQPAVVYAFHPRTKQVREVGPLSGDSARTFWLGDMDARGNPVFISTKKTNAVSFQYFDMKEGKVTATKEFVLEDQDHPALFVQKTSMGSESRPIYAVVTAVGLEFVQLDISARQITKHGDTLDAKDRGDPGNLIQGFSEVRSTNVDFNFMLDRDKSFESYRFMYDTGEFQPGDKNGKDAPLHDTPIIRSRTDLDEPLSVSVTRDGRIEAIIGSQAFDDSDKTYGRVRNIIPLKGLIDANKNPVFLIIDVNGLVGFISVSNEAKITDLKAFQFDQVKNEFGRLGQYWKRDAQYNPLTGLLSLSSDEGIVVFDIKSALTKQSRDELKEARVGARADAATPAWVPPQRRSGFEALDQRDDDLSGLPAAVRNIVRFLKEEDIDFIEEEEPDERPANWQVSNQLKAPLSLAMINFIFEYYAKEIDANPNMTMDDLVALLEENKDVELQDYVDTMISAIAGQDKTQHAWIREMIQNARDATRTERELGRLAKETGRVDIRNFTYQGQWVYSIRDPGGMSFWKLLRYYFPLDQSSKDFLKDTGNLGQGNYTLFADFDQIFIRTSTGDGTVHELTIEPNAEFGPVITRWEQWQGEYKGSEIRKIKKVKDSDPQLESLFIQDAMEHYTGAIQSPATRRSRGEDVLDRDMEIRYKGETYSEQIDITSSRFLGDNWGTLSVGRGQEIFRRRVIQDEIFVKDPDAKELKLVPEWLLADFERYGALHIGISKNILLNIPRTGYSQEHKFLQRLQVAVLHQMLRTVLEDSWEQPGEIFGMPPEYFGDMRVVDEPHARKIAELMAAGKYNEISQEMLAPYLSSPVRFFELMSHVLFDNKSGEETSLFEIREAMLEEAEIREAREGLKGRKKTTFKDIFKGLTPTGSLASFIKDVAGDRVFETKQIGGKLEVERRAIKEEKPFNVLEHITPEAKLRFDYISHLMIKTVADYGQTDMPPLNYFYQENQVEAHTVGHRVIEWNLYQLGQMVNELERLAQDPQQIKESLRKDENSPVWRMMEVVLHEPGHLDRWHKPGGHTHHHQEQVDEGFASNMGKFIDVVLNQFDLTEELTRSPEYMKRYLSSVDQAMLGELAAIREYLPRQFEITRRLNTLISDPRTNELIYKDNKRIKFSSFAVAVELLSKFSDQNPDLAGDVELALEILSLDPEQAAVILYGMDALVLKRFSYIQTKEWTTRLRMKRFQLSVSADATLATIWQQYENQARTEEERLWWRGIRGSVSPRGQSLSPVRQPVNFDVFRNEPGSFTSLTDRKFTDVIIPWFLTERNQDLNEDQYLQIERFAALLSRIAPFRGDMESTSHLYDLRVQLETKSEFPYLAYDAAYHAVRILREAGFQAGLVKRQHPRDPQQVYYYAQVSLLNNDFIVDLVADQHEIAQDADPSRLIFRPTFHDLGIVVIPTALVEQDAYRDRLPFYATWDIVEDQSEGALPGHVDRAQLTTDQAMLSDWSKSDFIAKGRDHRVSFKLYSQLSRSEKEKYADIIEGLRGERFLEDADGEDEDAFVVVLTSREKGTERQHESVLGLQAFDLPAKWQMTQVRAQGIDVVPEWFQSNIGRLLRDKTYRYLQEQGVHIFDILVIKQTQGTQVFHTKEIERLREQGVVFNEGDILFHDGSPDQLKTVSIHLKDYQPTPWSHRTEIAVIFDAQNKMFIDQSTRNDWSKSDFMERGTGHQLSFKLFSQLSDAEQQRYAQAIQALTETGRVGDIDGQNQDAFIAVITAEDEWGRQQEQVLGMQGFTVPANAVAGSLAAQGVDVIAGWRQANIARLLRAKMYHHLRDQGINDVRLSVILDQATQQFHKREIARLRQQGVIFNDFDIRYRPGYGQDSISHVRVRLGTYSPEDWSAMDQMPVVFDQDNKVAVQLETVDYASLTDEWRQTIISASMTDLKELDVSIAQAVRIQDKRVFGKNPFTGAVILGYPASDVLWFLRRGTANAIEENELRYPEGQQWVHQGTPDFLGESQEAQDLLDLWGDSIHAVQNLMNAVRKNLPLDFHSEPAILPQRMEMFAALTKELLSNDDFEAVEYLEKALDPTLIVFLLGVKKAGYFLFNGDRTIISRILKTKATRDQGIRSIINPWNEDMTRDSLILYRPVDVVENLKTLKQKGWLERLMREDVSFLFDKIDQMDRAMMPGTKADASVERDNVGGIDFNPQNLELRTGGEFVPINVPDIDIKSFDNPAFTGFTPVIMEIVPVTSFPMLLGTVTSEKPDQLSKVFR